MLFFFFFFFFFGGGGGGLGFKKQGHTLIEIVTICACTTVLCNNYSHQTFFYKSIHNRQVPQ